jgi:predicted protein tyrosine phosphatase
MDRRQAENMRGRTHAALISITDPRTPPPQIFEPAWSDVLRMKFSDLREDMPAYRTSGRIPPQKMHAQQIAAFIRANLNRNIFVHCETGIGRSAAVCAVLVDMGWRYLKPHELGLSTANPLLLRLLREELLVLHEDEAGDVKDKSKGCGPNRA